MSVFKRVPLGTQATRTSYDIVIIGGAASGASIAWHLSQNPDFNGSVLVVERDVSLKQSATMASNNCMRQQFATPLNIKIAQFGARFVREHAAEFPADHERTLGKAVRDFGYLYLSDHKSFTAVLERDQAVQKEHGASTEILAKSEIKERYPFFHTDDIDAGSLNVVDEGAFNAPGMVRWMREEAVERGVEYIEDEVVGMTMNVDRTRINTVTLKSGVSVIAGKVVNAAGTRAAEISRLIDIDLPIEARRRYTYIFSVDEPLQQDLPLTIDPSGVHFRSYGKHDYLVGCPPIGPDTAVDADDFEFVEDVWAQKMLPVLTHRIPQFKSAKVTDAWMGHYEFNTFDRNAIIGQHHVVPNFYLCVGFSGHGSQQAPACGRAIAELLVYDEFRTLDMAPLGWERIVQGRPLVERAVI